jgi:hypothetical protein
MMDNGLINEQIEAMRSTGRTDAQIGEQLAKRWSDEKMDKVIASRAAAKVHDQLEDKKREFNQGSRSNPIYTTEQEAEIAELERRLAVLDAQSEVALGDSGVICKLVVPDKIVAPTNIQVPDGVVGKVGMVAMLQRVRPEDDGKWVAVRRPVGMVTSLVGSKNPVFAWEVMVLGDPVQVNDKPCREIYVADQCLKPMTVITPEQVEVFVKARAKEDFNAALDDLAKILNATSMTPDEFEGFIDKAANQMNVERALEIVPTSVALTEIGFKPKQSAFEILGWVGVNDGWQIELSAFQDWFGRWNLSGTGKSPRTILCYEVNLPDEAMRGKTVAKVLDVWRTAYGTSAPVPDCLSLGVVYEEHQEAMRRLDPGMPHLYVDGFMFRATVKWLRRTLRAKEKNDYLLLSFSDGLLRLRFNDYVLGCPAHGIWTDDCQVSMKDLLTIEPWNLRGSSIRVERSNECVTFNGHSVRVP